MRKYLLQDRLCLFDGKHYRIIAVKYRANPAWVYYVAKRDLTR